MFSYRGGGDVGWCPSSLIFFDWVSEGFCREVRRTFLLRDAKIMCPCKAARLSSYHRTCPYGCQGNKNAVLSVLPQPVLVASTYFSSAPNRVPVQQYPSKSTRYSSTKPGTTYTDVRARVRTRTVKVILIGILLVFYFRGTAVHNSSAQQVGSGSSKVWRRVTCRVTTWEHEKHLAARCTWGCWWMTWKDLVVDLLFQVYLHCIIFFLNPLSDGWK